MAVFAIVALDAPSSELETSVHKNYRDGFLKVAEGHWLISAQGTAESVGVTLGVKDGKIGRAMIYNVGGYYGWAPTNIWEWVRSNWGKSGG